MKKIFSQIFIGLAFVFSATGVLAESESTPPPTFDLGSPIPNFVTESGTLEISEDNYGTKIDVVFPVRSGTAYSYIGTIDGELRVYKEGEEYYNSSPLAVKTADISFDSTDNNLAYARFEVLFKYKSSTMEVNRSLYPFEEGSGYSFVYMANASGDIIEEDEVDNSAILTEDFPEYFDPYTLSIESEISGEFFDDGNVIVIDDFIGLRIGDEFNITANISSSQGKEYEPVLEGFKPDQIICNDAPDSGVLNTKTWSCNVIGTGTGNSELFVFPKGFPEFKSSSIVVQVVQTEPVTIIESNTEVYVQNGDAISVYDEFVELEVGDEFWIESKFINAEGNIDPILKGVKNNQITCRAPVKLSAHHWSWDCEVIGSGNGNNELFVTPSGSYTSEFSSVVVQVKKTPKLSQCDISVTGNPYLRYYTYDGEGDSKLKGNDVKLKAGIRKKGTCNTNVETKITINNIPYYVSLKPSDFNNDRANIEYSVYTDVETSTIEVKRNRHNLKTNNSYTLSIKADYANRITETNEGNNFRSAYRSFSITDPSDYKNYSYKAKNFKTLKKKTKKTFSDKNRIKRKDAVDYLSERGIINGYQNGQFKPQNSVTRAEALKMIFTAVSEESSAEVSRVSFKDVDNADWFAGYVQMAYENGYVKGYKDGSFKPHKTVNKAELLKISFNIFGIEVDDYEAQNALPSDIEDYHWFKKYFAFAVDNDLIDLQYSKAYPDEQMTREEFSEFLYRLIQLQE